jgi:hypothetical protein
LVEAVARAAMRDADLVGHFLVALGLRPEAGRPARLPAGLLLDLGAAMRLLAWEAAGLDPGRIAGLPTAHEAVLSAFRDATPARPGEPPAGTSAPPPVGPPGSLAARALEAFARHFAWAGHLELGADVALDAADEDALLEAVADFLWTNRPA